MLPIERPAPVSNLDAPQDWIPVSIPFLKPPDQWPGPIPSEWNILEGTVLHGDASNHRIVAIGEHFVVKHGRGVDEVEGQNLLFLEQHRSDCLIVPKLYAMWYIAATGHLCLVMQRMPGENLEKLWLQLTEEQKSDVCARLKTAFDYLRQLPSPGFYGGIGRTPLPHHFFWYRPRDPTICGPFRSEAELNAGIVQKLRNQSEENRGWLDIKIKFYERNLNAMLNGHDAVFSHSDLQQKNIMVHRHAGVIASVAIIDGEVAGWYPSYWEYCLRFATTIWEDDWMERLEDIIEPWPREAAVVRMLYQELFF
jgi:hypothetical protein